MSAWRKIINLLVRLGAAGVGDGRVIVVFNETSRDWLELQMPYKLRAFQYVLLVIRRGPRCLRR
jgi:hypothetical protein